jgi:hypothetical protein
MKEIKYGNKFNQRYFFIENCGCIGKHVIHKNDVRGIEHDDRTEMECTGSSRQDSCAPDRLMNQSVRELHTCVYAIKRR